MEWYYLVLISSVLMGVENVISKNSLKQEYATEFSAALTLLVALLSLIFIPFASFGLTMWQLLVLIIWSALNAYTFLLSARVFRHGELSVASPAFSSLPSLFTVLLAFFFLSEHLEAIQYAGIAGILAASYLLFFWVPKKSRPAFENKKYPYMILWYSFLFAITIVINKYVLYAMNPFTFLILSSIFMSIFFAIFISVKYTGITEIIKAVKKYPVPLVSNAILTLGYRITYYIALVVVPVSLAQPLRNVVYVIITVFLGCLIFREEGLERKLALSLVILFFAYLLTL